MSYDNTSNALEFLTESFASVIVDVDSKAEHSRWKPGIGPFEEERQIEMLVEAIGNYSGELSLKTERTYPSSQRRCDLIIETGIDQVPVEAKLLRFRYDNGSIDPASYARTFTPFPEESSSSLLTDAKRLRDSDFKRNGGLLGLYYEEENEEYDQMNVKKIAEKVRIDTDY